MIDHDKLRELSRNENLTFTLTKVGTKRSGMISSGETFKGYLNLAEGQNESLHLMVGHGLSDTVRTSAVESTELSGDMMAIETVGGFYELTWRNKDEKATS